MLEKVQLKLHVLPGGKLPERQTPGAIGYDVCLRAIVSPDQMDPQQPHLRKTLFNFQEPLVGSIPFPFASNIQREAGEWVYQLPPNQAVLGGIGFVTEMPFPMYYWVAPRSGLASRFSVTVANAPGTVDPDYRGEAGVVIRNEGTKVFSLRHGMRIAQIIFAEALIPEILVAPKYDDLGGSKRGAGGFGSTGLR